MEQTTATIFSLLFLLCSYFSSVLEVLSIYRLTSLGRGPKGKIQQLFLMSLTFILFHRTNPIFICTCKKLQQKSAQIAIIPNEP